MILKAEKDERLMEYFELVNENDSQEKRVAFLSDNAATQELLKLADTEIKNPEERRRFKKTMLAGARYSTSSFKAYQAHEYFLNHLDTTNVPVAMEDIPFALEEFRLHNYFPQMILIARQHFEFMAENAEQNRWAYYNFIMLLVDAYRSLKLVDFSFVLLYDLISRLGVETPEELSLISWATNQLRSSSISFGELQKRSISLSETHRKLLIPPDGPGLFDSNTLMVVANKEATFKKIASEGIETFVVADSSQTIANNQNVPPKDRTKISNNKPSKFPGQRTLIKFIKSIPPLFWLARKTIKVLRAIKA